MFGLVYFCYFSINGVFGLEKVFNKLSIELMTELMSCGIYFWVFFVVFIMVLDSWFLVK